MAPMRVQIRALLNTRHAPDECRGDVLGGRLLASLAATAGLGVGAERAMQLLERWCAEVGADALAEEILRGLQGLRGGREFGERAVLAAPYPPPARRAVAMFAATSIAASHRARPELASREIDLTWRVNDETVGFRASLAGTVRLTRDASTGAPTAPSRIPTDFTDAEWPAIHAELKKAQPWIVPLIHHPSREVRQERWLALQSGYNDQLERWARSPSDTSLARWEPTPEEIVHSELGGEGFGFAVTSMSREGFRFAQPSPEDEGISEAPTGPNRGADRGAPPDQPHAVLPVPSIPMGWARAMQTSALGLRHQVRLSALGKRQPSGMRGVLEYVPKQAATDAASARAAQLMLERKARSERLRFVGVAPRPHRVAMFPLSPEVLLMRAATIDEPWLWSVEDDRSDTIALTRWQGDTIETIGLPCRTSPLPTRSIEYPGFAPPPIGIPSWLLDELFAWCRDACAQ